MNQNRKNHPFLRRALTAVLTLLMLVNVCFPAMQAHATEEELVTAHDYDVAVSAVKEAAIGLNPETDAETFKAAADAVTARIAELSAKVSAIVTDDTVITESNVSMFNTVLSDASTAVADKTQENDAYLAKQSQPPVTPAPSDNTSNVGGNEPEKDKTTAPADNTSNIGDEETTVSEAVQGYQNTLAELSARVEALKQMDNTTEEYADEETALWNELGALEASLGAAKEAGTITVEEYDALFAQQGAIVDAMPASDLLVEEDAVPYPVYSITLKPNTSRGGAGTDHTIQTDRDGNFTFPDPADVGITGQSGYVFAGWHQDKERPEAYNHYTYQPGVQIEVSGIQTYYATWINTNSATLSSANFYIRLDGIMPYEPNSYWSGYTDGTTINNALRSEVGVNNNLAKVQMNLANVPTDDQIKSDLAKKGVTYDPAKQEIVWYVIKLQGYGAMTWHVDGVIRDKTQYWVIYHPNGGTTDGIPPAKQYPENNNVEVEYENNNHEPTRAGYVFLGWDENSDATTPTYPVNGTLNSFTMPAHDVNLYAIWRPSDATQYKIEYYLEQENGSYEKQEPATVTKYGTTDTEVEVSDSDIKSFDGWTYNPDNGNNVKSGTIAADGSLVLKLYYELPDVANLTINKTFSGLDENAVKPNTITVTVSDGETSQDVTLESNDERSTYSATVEDLTIGTTYTVTEDTDSATIENWTLTGTTYNGEDSGSVTIAAENNVMNIVNTYERAKTQITLTKMVEGNMASHSEKFIFVVTVDGVQQESKIELSHNNSATIEVPIGAKVEIMERQVAGYTATATLDDKEATLSGTTLTIEKVGKDGHTVVFTNTNNATIETGVTRTSFPFILLLSTAIVFAMILLMDKARYGKKF